MKTIFATIAAKYLKPVLMVLSVIILLRGHNNPGGGFIAALVLASGIIFQAVIDASDDRIESLKKVSRILVTSGMISVLLAAMAGLIAGEPFLSALWTEIRLPVAGQVELGTPMLFDTGIYLVVTGGLLLIFQSVIQEIEWK